MSNAEYPLNISGEPYKANRTNTTLFTYVGENCLYDHVFLVIGEEGEELKGCYVFKVAQEPLYTKLGKFIVDNNLPQILNRLEVPECDMNAWNNAMMGDLNKTDTIPEGWE